MFDVGFWEFALIGIITLIVVGPERMPAIAKTAGRYVGKAKRFVNKIQDDINNEIEVDDLKEHLNLEDKDANIVEIIDETKESFKGSLKDIKHEVDK